MMRNKIIGITGGIATGKSTLVNFLKEKGYTVIDSDMIAHEVIDIDTVKQLIKEKIGDKFFVNDRIDRDLLGKEVFHHPAKRKLLESIVFPFIFQEILDLININKDKKAVFIDVPLLFEIKEQLPICFDEIWLVYAQEQQQIQRMIDNRGMDKEDALKRLEAQIPIDEKRILADIVFDNTGSINTLFGELDRQLIRLEGEDDENIT